MPPQSWHVERPVAPHAVQSGKPVSRGRPAGAGRSPTVAFGRSGLLVLGPALQLQGLQRARSATTGQHSSRPFLAVRTRKQNFM